MTYEEIIYEVATCASNIARVMTDPDVSDEEAFYLNRALHDLKIFGAVRRKNKVFKED